MVKLIEAEEFPTGSFRAILSAPLVAGEGSSKKDADKIWNSYVQARTDAEIHVVVGYVSSIEGPSAEIEADVHKDVRDGIGEGRL